MIQMQPIPSRVRRRRFVISLIAISVAAGVAGAIIAVAMGA
jgi:hypothetical protein